MAAGRRCGPKSARAGQHWSFDRVTVPVAQADEADDWRAARIEKLKAEANRQRQGHRVAAGKALHAMRLLVASCQ
ncbi:hypothetical protein [Mycobacterium sp.]|uniref:hypothetical protein n=1 Tax=Mycobacterium sp. TaxID=1785 RepID=UPI003F9A4DD4